MIVTVSTARLDRVRVQGKYQSPMLEEKDLLSVYKAISTVFEKRLLTRAVVPDILKA